MMNLMTFPKMCNEDENLHEESCLLDVGIHSSHNDKTLKKLTVMFLYIIYISQPYPNIQFIALPGD